MYRKESHPKQFLPFSTDKIQKTNEPDTTNDNQNASYISSTFLKKTETYVTSSIHDSSTIIVNPIKITTSFEEPIIIQTSAQILNDSQITSQSKSTLETTSESEESVTKSPYK